MTPSRPGNNRDPRFTDAERDYGGIKELIFLVGGGMVLILLLMMAAVAVPPRYTMWVYALGALLFVAAGVFLVVKGSRLWRTPRRGR